MLCKNEIFHKRCISETKKVKGALNFMIPYVLLMFFPLMFSLVMFSKRNGKMTVALGGNREILNHSFMLPMFFVVLITLLSLRDETIGRDLIKYKYYFEQISTLKFGELYLSELDFLYVLLAWIVSRFTDSFQIFLTVVAIITVVPIAIVYCEDRQNGFLKLILFMNIPTFVMIFSGLRQALAITMGLVAYEFVKRKKLIFFLLFAFVAMGFHHSAFMVFFFYPLYYASFRKKHLWFIVPIVLFIVIFNRPVFTALTFVLSFLFGEKYTATTDSTGAYTMLILFGLFAVFSYVLPEEEKMDKEALGLRNLLMMAVILQCFAPVHALAMRMNYYYIILIPILIPKLFRYSKTSFKEVVPFAKAVLIVFFVCYYLITTYNSCQTGISSLDTYPYVPFWK